ncbi:hypothetical protein J4E83_007063 [Alternaria metachromatica]|uniref:uncharacterized protein n=1 Tax=Alternaria metachromatica TaxID=283354 RepID=UPI0020C58D65|nr:uncharacterized protein J4E83_007063 [Alternaria metachromatica]KAI4614410.1 hypothetical protein J4E83_007063 [Alternaria metachromatica]
MAPDLSLPPQAPELGRCGDEFDWNRAAFAVYTLVDGVSLQDVASTLEKQWLEQGNEDHLVRPAPSTSELKTLLEVLQAHIALEKGADSETDELEWWPTAFIVVVRKDWKEPGGLLFVFADDENDYKLDKFFFQVDDAYMMLSSLSFQDETEAGSKEVYAQGYYDDAEWRSYPELPQPHRR